ncbi:MAG: pyruvate ferredoxin oxidoreductase [Candidatus Altiarchaeales archaeon HGW-Altiarchaeales-3]|nr:MAG: pyruvate ferredoxin oxidoreductase [Candidatus Altiarchaeales archaeon HGW-Altiarchaeales-3]
MTKTILEGSQAAAVAVKLCKPKVIAAYPITPQTHIVEDLAKMVANGEIDAEYIKVESEHSAMSACVGASAAGVRTYTATSSQGLALMHEILYVVSGMRLPVVMVNANRALSAPISIWNDQGDSMGQRDTGWLHLFAETNQEVLDLTIQAYKIAENRDILLPVMVCMDGFTLTHTVEPVDVPDPEDVDSFLPDYKPLYKLDTENPMTFGPIAFPDAYMEFRKMQWDAMNKSKEVIKEVAAEFKEKFGRSAGNGLIEEYNMENAEYALVTLGSVAGTIKDVIDGTNVGLIRIVAYRPFPIEDLRTALKGVKAVGVIEKDVSIGLGGAVWIELKALIDNPCYGFIAGLGGRDITLDTVQKIIDDLKSEDVKDVNWVEVNV